MPRTARSRPTRAPRRPPPRRRRARPNPPQRGQPPPGQPPRTTRTTRAYKLRIELSVPFRFAVAGLRSVNDVGDELLEQLEYAAGSASPALEQGELTRGQIEDALELAGGSQLAAARRLGMPRSTLRYRMVQLGMEMPGVKRRT